MNIDTIIAGIGGLVAGIGGAIAHAKRLESKLAPFLRGAINVVERVKDNHEAQTAIADIKNALATESASERDALYKSAAHAAVSALGVEIGSLTDIQKAAIAGYISDVVPDRYKADVTPVKIADTLSAISAEITAAKSHDGMKAAQAFVAFLSQQSNTL